MIKFFRKIRQKLLTENRFSKYLIYAVGEIILVVIGILIALQINNWNEAKKAKEKERQVLTEIISDLDYTLLDLNRVIRKRTNNLYKTRNSLKTIINVLETDKKYHDSLALNFRAVYAYDDVDFKTSGYQSLVSIGTDLVENPKLRSAIGKFHTSSISNSKGSFEELHLDFYSYMIDYFRKNFTTVFIDNALEKLEPSDFEALKRDKEYIQSLKTFLAVNIAYFETLIKVEKEAQQLKIDIENYLND